VKANQADYPVTVLCEVLGVSRSGYYAWLERPPSKRAIANEELTERIWMIHTDSRETYGCPRITAELRDDGECVGHNRVARLMKAAGIEGISRRRRRGTTRRDRDARPAPDLVERDFGAPTGPDQLWVADITYVPTWAGFLYLSVVVDAWSRRVVGWAMANHLRTELVLDALNMALWQRSPEAVVHHSGQGTQGRFNRWSQHLKEGGCHAGWKETTFRSSWTSEDEFVWQAFGGTGCRAAAVLGSDRGRGFQRGCRGRGRGVARRRHTLVPGGRGYAAIAPQSVIASAFGTVFELCRTRRNRDLECAGACHP